MSSRYATIVGYLLVVAAGLTLQVAAVRRPEKVPTLGRVVTHVMRSRTGRVGIFVAWAWVGLHFFAK